MSIGTVFSLLRGASFFFGTDVKEQEVANTNKRIAESIAKGEGRTSVQRADVARAGVGIVLSKYMRTSCMMLIRSSDVLSV